MLKQHLERMGLNVIDSNAGKATHGILNDFLVRNCYKSIADYNQLVMSDV